MNTLDRAQEAYDAMLPVDWDEEEDCTEQDEDWRIAAYIIENDLI